MLFVVEDKSQVAFMAPTEVLADQHYKSIKNLASKLNLSVAVLTGSTKEKERKVILNQLIKGEINILIGTIIASMATNSKDGCVCHPFHT